MIRYILEVAISIKIRKGITKTSEKEISELEAAFNCRLPSCFKQFLLTNNGGTPSTNEFEIPNENNSSGVNKFLAVKEIIKQKKILNDRLLRETVPFAYAEGGNYICLITDGPEIGKIYFRDHELEEEDAPPSWNNMFLLANSLCEFLLNLKAFDPKSVVIKPGQIKSMWIHPSLLKK